MVDDGSTDDTARIVREFQQDDPRILLVEQVNGGVAKARNAGIAAARSEFVAPLDADDLWHPKRLELHLQAFDESPGVALVYSPSVLIDDRDRIITSSIYVDIQGNVFEPHLCFNFIGNGSSITVRTKIARDIGGYSSELKSRGGQGCEDWLFQLKVAYRNKFACVPLHLVGYRTTDENMSSDLFSMRRSGLEAMREIESYAPALPRPLFWWPQARMKGRLVLEYAKMGQRSKAVSEFVRFSRSNPLLPFFVPSLVAVRLFTRLKARLAGAVPRDKLLHFSRLDPADVRRVLPGVPTRFWLFLYGQLARRRLLREAQAGRPAGGRKSAI